MEISRTKRVFMAWFGGLGYAIDVLPVVGALSDELRVPFLYSTGEGGRFSGHKILQYNGLSNTSDLESFMSAGN